MMVDLLPLLPVQLRFFNLTLILLPLYLPFLLSFLLPILFGFLLRLLLLHLSTTRPLLLLIILPFFFDPVLPLLPQLT